MTSGGDRCGSVPYRCGCGSEFSSYGTFRQHRLLMVSTELGSVFSAVVDSAQEVAGLLAANDRTGGVDV